VHLVNAVRGAGVLALAALAGLSLTATPDPMAPLPSVLLWAWERPEDVRFAPQLGVGVAALDRTVTLRGAAMRVDPRRQPIRLDPSTPVVSVVRLEADAAAAAAADPARVAEAIAAAARRPGARALQIDFDATASQRGFYARLLADVRRRVPGDLPISMTVLASWCAGDRWIEALPIDEAVPMLFEMGPDRASVLRRVRHGQPFADGRCSRAIGASPREPLARVPRADRTYLFAYEPWTIETARAALRGVAR
jgi:hypothetical protein